MPKLKIYKIPLSSGARSCSAAEGQAEYSSPPHSPPENFTDAKIELVTLLGPNGRFARTQKNIDLTKWLGKGIDAWVWAAYQSFKAMLLSGKRQSSTVTWYATTLSKFFTYLTKGLETPRAVTPRELSPIHVEAYANWLEKCEKQEGWGKHTARKYFDGLKHIILEMFAAGYILGDHSRFFRRARLNVHKGPSRQTSLSDTEQARLAAAIKKDLVAIHHGLLSLLPVQVQGLRLLMIAHRQGLNMTPLLEMRRDSISNGLLPGTIRMRTEKYRGRTAKESAGRDISGGRNAAESEGLDVIFNLSEGAIIRMALSATEQLVAIAPPELQNRVWLYQGQGYGPKCSVVTCLTMVTVRNSIQSLIARHQLLGDDGLPLRVNVSRLRKSFYDRALRISDGDQLKAANLLGNSEQIAAVHYSGMNWSKEIEAASFMNGDYLPLMKPARVEADGRDEGVNADLPIEANSRSVSVESTPVSSCRDTLHGEFAPRDGTNHCDRYVMCLFCSSFAIAGTVEELWRLFSFQAFAKEELDNLEAAFEFSGPADDLTEDLKARYRAAIPYIDEFVQRQFSAKIVAEARAKTSERLHPIWTHLMAVSQRARSNSVDVSRGSDIV